MTALDAFAVLAFLRDEPAADEVEQLLRAPTVLAAVNAAEIVDQLVRVYGHDVDDVHADLALLSRSGMGIAATTSGTGIEAGRIRAAHYRRRGCPVTMADCVAAATALDLKLPLATSDAALAAVVRHEGGAVHPLPNGRGVRP